MGSGRGKTVLTAYHPHSSRVRQCIGLLSIFCVCAFPTCCCAALSKGSDKALT